MPRLRVVLAEDNPADELVIQEALVRRFPDLEFTVRRDGEQMMRWLDLVETEYSSTPDVILLDLNLPRFTGEQILLRLRASSKCQSIPVVIVSSSEAAYDREMTARLGAARYFCKSSEYDSFMKLGDLVHEVLMRKMPAGTPEA
jgi:CheY-like chemotaxis protein